MVCRLSGRRVFVSDLGGGGGDVSAYVSTDRWFAGHLPISEYSRRINGHGNKPWAHVVLGGVDTEKFCPDGSVPRSQSVLFVGRLLPHKGVDDLIGAVTEDMALGFIGQPYNQKYLGAFPKLAPGNQVRFIHD